MNYSDSQKSVFKAVNSNESHISINATAGSGKTTTLLGAFSHIPPSKKSIFLSFSNTIVDELKDRVPSHIKASTLHSLGCRMIMQNIRGLKITKDKYFQLAIDSFPKKDRGQKGFLKKCASIQDICNFARMTLSEFDIKSIEELCCYYNIDYEVELIEKAIKILKKNTKLKDIKSIDFTDMIYLPAVYSRIIVNEEFDFVFLDEAQDTNKAQFKFIENILKKPEGKLVAVGDENQTIYGFAGNDIESFKRIKERKNTLSLPLTVSYRCAKEIVKLAQTIYPKDIQHHEDAIEGEVIRDGDIREAEPGDMILCRNTRPLISAFFDLLNQNKKSYIVGKEFEKGLVNLSETLIENCYSKDGLKQNISNRIEWQFNELKKQKIENPQNHPKFLNLIEKCEIIKFLLNRIEGIHQLVPKIKEIFHEEKKAIRLLTIHRSKGLESDKVFFIETFNGEKLCPSKWAQKDWEKVQEQNLLFVCYTRAKHSFIFINYNEC